MADGDVYKTTLEWVYRDIDVAVQNVVYFRQSGSFVDPLHIPELDLGARIKGVWMLPNGAGDFRIQYLSTQFAFLNVRAQRVWPVVSGAYLTPVNVAGGNPYSVTYVPSTACLMVRLRSTDNERRGRGRVYMGGYGAIRNAIPPDGALANHGYWNDPFVAITQLWWQTIQTTCGIPGADGVSFDLGVWSRAVAGAHPPYAYAFNPLSSIEATRAIRVQRSREVGVGI